MEKKHVKKLLDSMMRYYGYTLVEIGNVEGLLSEWAVMKELEHIRRIIVFTEYNHNIIKEDVAKRLQDQNLSNNIEIVAVTLLDSNIKGLGEAGQWSANLEPRGEKLIIINLYQNNITYFDETLDEVIRELANVISYNRPQRQNRKTSMATLVLIGINVLVFLITAFLSNSIFNSDTGVLIKLGAKFNPLIDQGEYYRFLTCMFLHGGIIHIALNMYALYSIGPMIEELYGRSKYLIIYFITGIISSIASYIFSTGVSVGASGAIFGLLGAALAYAFKERNNIGKDFFRNIASVLVVNLIIGLSIPNIDNYAHIGGALGGVVLGEIYLNLFRKKI